MGPSTSSGRVRCLEGSSHLSLINRRSDGEDGVDVRDGYREIYLVCAPRRYIRSCNPYMSGGFSCHGTPFPGELYFLTEWINSRCIQLCCKPFISTQTGCPWLRKTSLYTVVARNYHVSSRSPCATFEVRHGHHRSTPSFSCNTSLPKTSTSGCELCCSLGGTSFTRR